MDEKGDHEKVLSKYSKGEGVSSLISMDVEVEKSDQIAEKLSSFDNVEDVFLLTGEVDLIVKARFEDYNHMKTFLTEEIDQIDGIRDENSMMIVSAYKEKNDIIATDQE